MTVNLDVNNSSSTDTLDSDMKQSMHKIQNLKEAYLASKYFRISYYMNNLTFIIFIWFYMCIQVSLLFIQYDIYKGNNEWYILARLCGILLDFNLSFMVLLVARRTLAFLRNTKIGQICLPFDNFIDLHKKIGIFIIIIAIVHTIGHSVHLWVISKEYVELHPTRHLHMLNVSYSTTTTPAIPFVDLLFTTKSGIGWFYKIAMPTGWAALGILLILSIFSLPYFRTNGHFELFHYTHFLYIILYIVTILHTTNYWKWFIVPGFFLLLECVIRTISTYSSRFGSTYLKDVNILPSNVTHLVLQRPKYFKFKPGDYIFLNIPNLSTHEWHPFTISSSPELKDEIWVHIRSLGTWTNKLHEHFMNKKVEEPISNDKEEKPENENEFVLDMVHASKTKIECTISYPIKNVFYKVFLDGPYGTASNRTFRTEHAVLISSGIGVTPFASILQCVWFKYAKCSHICPNCNFLWYDEYKEKKLKKVDFVWVNRDFKAFEWFIDLLGQLERLQNESKIERFINFHLFMSSATNKDTIRNDAIQSLTTLRKKQAESPNDFLRLIEKIEPGRPNLDELLTKIIETKKGDMEVIFCGSNQFGKIVKKKCLQYNLKFSKEKF